MISTAKVECRWCTRRFGIPLCSRFR